MQSPARLHFSGISHDFHGPGGGIPVLRDIGFGVAAGRFVAVIGPSGCGKSTLLQMAAGLLRPGAGTVTRDGKATQGVQDVGFVPQQALLFPWKTLEENVGLKLEFAGVRAAERRERVRQALLDVGLDGFGGYYPRQLSGGMQKRGAIARTLVYRPELILMDEPFGALDAQTRMVMQRDLQALVMRGGASVLLVTHDITEAVLLADEVVVLSRRPARLLSRHLVELPRPRDVFEPFRNPGFDAAYAAIWAAFRGEGRVVIRRAMLAAAPGLALLVLWEFASGRLVREIYVSRPTAVLARLHEMFASGEIQPHLWVTLQELVLGYVFGVVGGVACGYALGRAPRAAAVFEPYLMAFYGVPKIALAPLFIVWFGIAIWSKVALAGTMVFFLVFYSVYAGVRAVDQELVNLARVMGATQGQLTRHVYLPAAAPAVLLGMRMAIPYSVIGVIAGEFTSSVKGLGLFINQASATYDPAGVFAGIVLLLGFVVVAGALAGQVEKRLLRWRPPLPGQGTDG